MDFRFSNLFAIITLIYLFGGFNLNKEGSQNIHQYGCNANLVNCQEQMPHNRSHNDTESKAHMTKIIGNGQGPTYEHSVRISLVGNFKSAQCSGTIHNALYIITSAHCIYGIEPSKVIVTVGMFFDVEQNRSVVSIEIHKDYNSDTFSNDIALLQLNISLVLSKGQIMPITLGKPNLMNATVTHEYIVGYGLAKGAAGKCNYPRNAKMVGAAIKDLATCKDIYQKLEKHIYENQICAGGEVGLGPCKGDEGAPLTLRVQHADTTWKMYVIGILSTYQGCAAGIPEIYTQLENYTSWIESKAGKQCDFNVFAYQHTKPVKNSNPKRSAKPKGRISEGIANQICASYNQLLYTTEIQPPIKSPAMLWNDAQQFPVEADRHYCTNLQWNVCDGCLKFIRVKCRNADKDLKSAKSTRQLTARIKGGHDAFPNQHPYLVRISVTKDDRIIPAICSGTIYNTFYILTSAECVHSGVSCVLTVIAGDHSVHQKDETEQHRKVVAVLIHEQFDRDNWWNHDIALLRLDSPLNFTNLVHSVLLATTEYPTADVHSTQLSGWGPVDSDGNKPEILQTLEIPFIDDCNCRLYYSYKNQFPLTENKFCAGPGYCDVNGGNPLTAKDGETIYLVGIASFSASCGNAPTVATKVLAYSEWIATRAG